MELDDETRVALGFSRQGNNPQTGAGGSKANRNAVCNSQGLTKLPPRYRDKNPSRQVKPNADKD